MLNVKVEANGANFSQGERQLICLARVLIVNHCFSLGKLINDADTPQLYHPPITSQTHLSWTRGPLVNSPPLAHPTPCFYLKNIIQATNFLCPQIVTPYLKEKTKGPADGRGYCQYR